MNDGRDDTQPDRSREDLERDAERARAELLTTLDVLDRRRHDLSDMKTQVEEHAAPLLGGAVVAVLVIGGAIGAGIHHALDRRRHPGRERLRALQRLWRHPELAGRPTRKSLFAELGRRVLTSVLSVVATQLASHAMKFGLAMSGGQLAPPTARRDRARPIVPPMDGMNRFTK